MTPKRKVRIKAAIALLSIVVGGVAFSELGIWLMETGRGDYVTNFMFAVAGALFLYLLKLVYKELIDHFS